MVWRVEPRRDHLRRCRKAHGEVLAPCRPGEPGSREPLVACRAVRADVREHVAASHVIGVGLGGGHQPRVVSEGRSPGLLPLSIDEVVDVLLWRGVLRRTGTGQRCGRLGRRSGVQHPAGHDAAGRHRKRGSDAGASPLGKAGSLHWVVSLFVPGTSALGLRIPTMGAAHERHVGPP